MSSNKRVSIFTNQYGHLSIAQSVQELLESHQYQVHLNSTKTVVNSLYTPFYLFFPSLFKIPYKLSQLKQAQQILRKSAFSNQDYVKKALEEQQPHIVISTWYLDNLVLDEIVEDYQFQYLNIVTDPRTFSALIPSKKAYNFVFDDQAAKNCQNIAIPPSQIIKAGWFVKSKYERPYKKNRLRKKLDINPNTITIVVVAGSEGSNLVLKILPTFLTSKTPLNVFFACGNNKNLFNLINNTDKLKSQTHKSSPVKLIPLQFKPNLHQYLQAADLVIGKAGPNLLFETTATQTPFFAITHIAGQEDGNLEIIKDYNLGYVEENLIKANQLLRRIIAQPNTLKQFSPSIKKTAQHNHSAKKILIDFIQKNQTQ